MPKTTPPVPTTPPPRPSPTPGPRHPLSPRDPRCSPPPRGPRPTRPAPPQHVHALPRDDGPGLHRGRLAVRSRQPRLGSPGRKPLQLLPDLGHRLVDHPHARLRRHEHPGRPHVQRLAGRDHQEDSRQADRRRRGSRCLLDHPVLLRGQRRRRRPGTLPGPGWVSGAVDPGLHRPRRHHHVRPAGLPHHREGRPAHRRPDGCLVHRHRHHHQARLDGCRRRSRRTRSAQRRRAAPRCAGRHELLPQRRLLRRLRLA